MRAPPASGGALSLVTMSQNSCLVQAAQSVSRATLSSSASGDGRAVSIAHVVAAIAVVIQPFGAARIIFVAVLAAGVGRLVDEHVIRRGIVRWKYVLAHRSVVRRVRIRMAGLAFRHAGIRVVLAQSGAKAGRCVVVTRVFLPAVTAHAANLAKVR